MRIIGGSARGRKLKSPPGTVRPTSDRVREALFSILQAEIRDATFLDLCAGSGAVGLEAISRGARRTVFVEENPRRAAAIRDALARMQWTDRGEVRRGDALRFVERLNGEFDIVFVDPPYRSATLVSLLPVIARRGVVRPSGVLVVEHASGEEIPALSGDFGEPRRYKYGDTTLTVLHRETLTEQNPKNKR